MNINIEVRHGSLAEASKTKITEKVARLERLIDRISAIDVIVDLERPHALTLELVVATDLKKTFRAEYSSADLFGCLDQTIEKVEQQMRAFKDKLTSHNTGEKIVE